MEDINQLAQQLITALRNSTEAGIELEGLKRRNTFEDQLNTGAARGTLYSTAGRNQQSRYDGSTYLPAVTQARGGLAQQEISIKSNLIDNQRKIDSMNRAAREINGITFDHLLD